MTALLQASTLLGLATAADDAALDLTASVAESLAAIEVSRRTRASIVRWLEHDPALRVRDLLVQRRPAGIPWTKTIQSDLVAAVRTWLLTRDAADGGSTVRRPVQGLPENVTEAGLEAWAARHEATAYVRTTVDRLAGYMPAGPTRSELSWQRGTTVRQALVPVRRGRQLVSARSVTAIRDALASIARQIAAAIDEEAASPPRVEPTDPAFASLWRSWTAVRSKLRTGAHPVGRALRATYKVSVLPEVPLLRIEADGSIGCVSLGRCNIDLKLQPPQDLTELTCACPGLPPSCPTKIGALDRALDELSDADGPIAREIAQQLAIPAWTRVLARVDAVVAAPDAIAPLGWRIVDRHGQLEPEAVTFRPAKSSSGFVIAKANANAIHQLARDRDVRVLDELRHLNMYGYRGDAREASAHRALRLLVGHPHVFFGKQPIEVVEEAWDLVVDGGDDHQARLRVHHGGASTTPAAFLDALVGQVAGGLGVRLDRQGSRLVVVALAAPAHRLIDLLAQAPADFPPEAIEPLLRTIDRWRDVVPVRYTGRLRGEPVAPSERLEVRLGVPAPGVLRVALRVRPLEGGAALVPGEGLVEPFGVVDGRRVYTTRDLDRERDRLAAVWAGLPGEPRADADLEDPETALPWLERVRELPDVDVTWDGTRRWRLGSSVSARDLRLRARDARSWFALDGDLTVDDDTVPLSTLLAAVRERRTYVPVGADRWAKLEDTLRSQVEALARGQKADDTGIELSAVHLPLVDALAEAGAQLDGSAAMLGLLERLRTADVEEIAPPKDLRAELRPYQRDGHRFLARLSRWAPGAFLADDMGLGKTIQALALLLDRASLGPALVVAPTSVGFNWLREAERFAPSLNVASWRGADRRAQLPSLGAGDVIVTSYDLVQRDADALADVAFATVVLDEAQAVKNAATRRWKAVAGLQRAFTVALTGTPVENRLDELWSLASLVVPGLFGDQRGFRSTWAVPVERDGVVEVRQALSRRLRPFLLRRTKAAVAPELPERTVVDVKVPLSFEERQVYDDVRRGALVELDLHADEAAAQTRIRVLAALTALRRVACHPALHDPSWRGATSKLTQVRELVAELRSEGHKALVFSQFVGHLRLVREALEEDGAVVRYLDGSTPEAVRRTEVDAFQRGEGDVFLISLKAGGTGLNLTAASYVLHLDPWWNPAVEDQATDRAHRIGQTRAVTVYRVIAEGTVEEQILKLHEDKRSLVAGVLEGTDAGATLGTADLWALLSDAAPTEVDVVSEPDAPAVAAEPETVVRAAEPETARPRVEAAESAPAVRAGEPAPSKRRARAAAAEPATARDAEPVPRLERPTAELPEPSATGWTPDRLQSSVEAELVAEVAAGRVAASSGAAYRSALARLLAREGAAAALASAATFEAFVHGETKPGPMRVVGMRAARVMRKSGAR